MVGTGEVDVAAVNGEVAAHLATGKAASATTQFAATSEGDAVQSATELDLGTEVQRELRQ